MTDSHDNEAAERVRGFLDWQDDGDLIASAYDENEGVRTLEVDDLRAVLAENKTMRQQLAAGSWEWAWRSKSANGPGEVIFPASSQKEATDNVLQRRLKLDSRDRYQVLRRLIGEWQPAERDE